ncbi:MAG TPA: signal peptidase II [Chitinispirillaceae bacterium]|nr:signal peptidase II [Chitinispirillaceae bacterium]
MLKNLAKYSIIIFTIFGGLGADFYSKQWAEKNLNNKVPVTVLKNFLDLGFAENRGMVFGMFNGSMSRCSSTMMVVLRTLILVALTVFIWVKRRQTYLFLLPFLLFWAGAIGNLIDSFTRGYVVDFIHIHAGKVLNWPFYFNLADAYVTIGMVLVVVYEIIGIIRKSPSFLTQQ